MVTDQELQALHDGAEGQTRELYAELIQARKALPLAKKIAQLGPILETNVYGMELQGAPRQELFLGVLHKKPDGGGRVGPSWELGEFAQDLNELSKALSTKEELMELKALGIVAMFGGGPRKA